MFSRFKTAAIGLATAIAMLAAVPGYAKGSSSYPTSGSGASSVISKDDASGFYYTHKWTIGNNGQILICPSNAEYGHKDNTCLIGGKVNWWLSPERVAASYGRTYTGFQIIRHHHAVELVLFWK